MEENIRFTLTKEERICSKMLIDQLFEKGDSHSMSAFPIRAVYNTEISADDDSPSVRILVSVPKRYFKRAVKRNRVKRQIREAYRLNKYIIINKVEAVPHRKMLLAFIWNDARLYDSAQVSSKVVKLLLRIGERINESNVALSE